MSERYRFNKAKGDFQAMTLMLMISICAFVFVKYQKYEQQDPLTEVVYFDDVCRCDIKKVVKNFDRSGEFVKFTLEGMEYQLDSSLVKSVTKK